MEASRAVQVAAAIALSDYEQTLAAENLSAAQLAGAGGIPLDVAQEALAHLAAAGLGRGGSGTLEMLAAAGMARRLGDALPASADEMRRIELALLAAAGRAAGGKLAAEDGLLLRRARELLVTAATPMTAPGSVSRRAAARQAAFTAADSKREQYADLPAEDVEQGDRIIPANSPDGGTRLVTSIQRIDQVALITHQGPHGDRTVDIRLQQLPVKVLPPWRPAPGPSPPGKPLADLGRVTFPGRLAGSLRAASPRPSWPLRMRGRGRSLGSPPPRTGR